MPGAIEQTRPLKSRPGNVSIVTLAGCAGVNVGEVRLLGIGVDPQAAVFDDGEHRLARRRDAAELDLVDLRRHAGDRRDDVGVRRLRSASSSPALAWM